MSIGIWNSNGDITKLNSVTSDCYTFLGGYRSKSGILISFIIVEFSFHAEKKKFIVWRSENLFSCPRAGKQAVFQL